MKTLRTLAARVRKPWLVAGILSTLVLGWSNIALKAQNGCFKFCGTGSQYYKGIRSSSDCTFCFTVCCTSNKNGCTSSYASCNDSCDGYYSCFSA
jgi:hypothetical protein